MRFLRKDKVKKSIIVISDIHLGAGAYVNSKKNYLEDFYYDKELVDFINFYSTGDYLNREVEMIINGDLFDLLAVPFVNYYDDEFWSEEASLDKLRLILDAHPEVIEAFGEFLSNKKKKIIFIIGNHDAEFVFPSLQKLLLDRIPEKVRDKFEIKLNSEAEYIPVEGIVLKHGHEYEIAHHFHPDDSIAEDENGKKYFIPPWGSYYVTRVINKFKEQRPHINAVRPIKKFMINGFIYDTLFTTRFGLATTFYFLMVRFIQLFKHKKSIGEVFKLAMSELELWKDYETLTEDFFKDRDDVKALIVGHTHDPMLRASADGTMFINTGTWTKMYHLDFGKSSSGAQLTFAQVDVYDEEKSKKGKFDHLDVNLNVWKGKSDLPFDEYN